jgi:hypothetical protein
VALTAVHDPRTCCSENHFLGKDSVQQVKIRALQGICNLLLQASTKYSFHIFFHPNLMLDAAPASTIPGLWTRRWQKSIDLCGCRFMYNVTTLKSTVNLEDLFEVTT